MRDEWVTLACFIFKKLIPQGGTKIESGAAGVLMIDRSSHKKSNAAD